MKFHPSDKFVATAGTDQHVFVTPVLGHETKMDTVAKMAVPAWINSLDWSPDGRNLVIVDHACNIRFYTLSENMEVEGKQELRWRLLPFISVRFTNNDTIICAGFDKLPVRYKRAADGSW